MNPADPQTAVLEHRSLWFGLLLAAPITLVVAALFGLAATRQRTKVPVRVRRGAHPGDAASSRHVRRRLARGLAPVFILFVLVGLAWLYLGTVRPLLRRRATSDWPETPCEVVSSAVRSHGGGTAYSVAVKYEYRFDGARYESDRYSLAGAPSGEYRAMLAIVEKLPPGKQTACYVDPEEPGEAVLRRERDGGPPVGVLPLVLLLVGAVGTVITVRYLRRHKRNEAETTAPGSAATGIPEHELRDREVVLRPPRVQVGKSTWVVISVAGFALALASALLILLSRSSSWFWVVWAAAIVAISVPPIRGLFLFLLGLANPRPRIAVSSNAVPIGESLDVRWEFRRSTSRLRSLSIWLEGREETVDAGMRTHVSVFGTVPIAETTSPRRMSAGTASVTVPADTMHSVRAPRNRIIWKFRVHGDVSLGTDLDRTFPFTVLPGPAPGTGR